MKKRNKLRRRMATLNSLTLPLKVILSQEICFGNMGSELRTFTIVKCRMALMRAGLWDNVSGNESAPAEEEAAKYSKSMARRDRDLATGGCQ